MKSFLCGLAIFMVTVAPVAAETRSDRNLEKAAMDIVAGKMGNLRGGFSYRQIPQLVVLPEAAPAVPVAVEPSRKQVSSSDGLMPAVERPTPQATF